MTPHQYVSGVVSKYTPSLAARTRVANARVNLYPLIKTFAGSYLLGFTTSGSYAKGTATTLGTDGDFFVSLSHTTPNTLSEIYWFLFEHLKNSGYTPTQQNVSIGINHGGLKLDIVPGKHQQTGTDHSLYKSKTRTWTQTNVGKHVALVKDSGRTPAVRATKIWRHRHGLEFPSFYLELTTMRALRGHPIDGDLSKKVWAVLEYIATSFLTARVVDPANTANVISDDLSRTQKLLIVQEAKASLAQPNWGYILW